jgi:hypothetical protein
VLSLSSDTVGIAVGVDATAPQAEVNNAIVVVRRILISKALPLLDKRTLSLRCPKGTLSARRAFIFFILTL